MASTDKARSAGFPWLLILAAPLVPFLAIGGTLLLDRLLGPFNAHGIGGIVVGLGVISEVVVAGLYLVLLPRALVVLYRQPDERNALNYVSLLVACLALALMVAQVLTDKLLPVPWLGA